MPQPPYRSAGLSVLQPLGHLGRPPGCPNPVISGKASLVFELLGKPNSICTY